MNNEDPKDTTSITTDDVAALRFLLHNVRGLSVISTAPSYALSDEEPLDQ